MNYTVLYVRLEFPSQEKYEILMAELYEAGFEGFIETETGFAGYIISDRFEKMDLKKLHFFNNPLLGPVTTEKEFILDKNWNELWEGNYEQAIISNEIIVRAPFHQSAAKYK